MESFILEIWLGRSAIDIKNEFECRTVEPTGTKRFSIGFTNSLGTNWIGILFSIMIEIYLKKKDILLALRSGYRQ